MPVDRELDAIALYVDVEEPRLDASKYEIGGNKAAKDLNNAAIRQSTSTGRTVHPDQIVSRTAFRVPLGEKVSFGAYFNAFPASYWRRWTVVTDVTLTLTVKGEGASVIVNKSTADGRSQKVDSAGVDGERAVLTFDLSLKPFVDGGWYWYDVVAGTSDAVVESAEWTAQVPADRAQHGTVDIAITTMLADMSAQLLGQLGDAEELAPYLDTVFVMDQGKDKVTDSEFFPAAEKGLGGKLRVIEQGNLGGSGGYARGQLESLRKGTATYTMMMDDDVVCEPEGIIRAVTFGDLCRRRRSSVGTCSASTPRAGCTASARSSSRGGSGGRRRSTATATGIWRPATSARRGGCTSGSTSTSTAGSCAWSRVRSSPRSACRCRSSSSGTTPSTGCVRRRPATRR